MLKWQCAFCRAVHYGMLLFVPAVGNTGKQLQQHRARRLFRTMEPARTDSAARAKEKANTRARAMAASRTHENPPRSAKLHQPAIRARFFLLRPKGAKQRQRQKPLPHMQAVAKKNVLSPRSSTSWDHDGKAEQEIMPKQATADDPALAAKTEMIKASQQLGAEVTLPPALKKLVDGEPATKSTPADIHRTARSLAKAQKVKPKPSM